MTRIPRTNQRSRCSLVALTTLLLAALAAPTPAAARPHDLDYAMRIDRVPHRALEVSRSAAERPADAPQGRRMTARWESSTARAKEAGARLVRLGVERHPASRILRGVPGVRQICSNWCGPAVAQEILRYTGRHYSQERLAALVGAPTCDLEYGTPLRPIVEVLNGWTGALRPGWAGYVRAHVPSRQDGATIAETARELEWRIIEDIAVHRMPVLLLLDPDGDDTGYTLPEWEGQNPTGHYIVVNGYTIRTVRGKRTVALHYRDTSHRLGDNALQRTAPLSGFAYTVWSKGGRGDGSERHFNVVW